jgi:hypothetical protein
MNKASTGKAERKISETILDFGEPLLSEAITEDTPIAAVREIYKLGGACLERARRSHPSLGRSRLSADAAGDGRFAADAIASACLDREALAPMAGKFSDAKYCVGEWHVKIKDDDTLSFFCDAREAPRR